MIETTVVPKRASDATSWIENDWMVDDGPVGELLAGHRRVGWSKLSLISRQVAGSIRAGMQA